MFSVRTYPWDELTGLHHEMKKGRNHMNVLKVVMIVALFLGLVPVVAAGQAHSPADREISAPDRALAEQIAKNVRRYVFYTIYDDVDIAVKNGVVTLTGRVTMPYKAEEIENLAARVDGVRSVNNQVLTLPVGSFDDQLRASIASRIYRDPLFWNYAIQVHPPIHIIVEHGRVTLTGVVSSVVEKMKAETIARGTFGVLGVENRLRIEGEETPES